MEYDLIIVGTGSVGSAAGYYASKAGSKVLMLDCDTPPHKTGQHHGSTRIFRCAYGEGVKYVPMVLRSKELWTELSEISGEEILSACGMLNMGPKDSEFMINAQECVKKFQLNAEVMTAEQVCDRWPGFTAPEDYLAVYEPDSGLVHCDIAVKTFVKLSKQAGAEQLFNTIVTEVRPIDDGVEVITNRGSFRSRKALVSAGTWIKNILPNMPITALRKVFMWHDADEVYKKIPSFIIEMDGDHYYGVPTEPSGLKVGKHNFGGQVMNSIEDYVPFGKVAEDPTETSKFLTIFIPGVKEMLRGETCMYDMTPDEDFIIDTMPGCDNVLLMIGLSGHGFKFTSALGEMAAMFARDEEFPIDLGAFSLKRFG